MISGVMIFLGEFRIETLIGSGGEAPVTKVSMSRLTTGYEVSREEEVRKRHLFSRIFHDIFFLKDFDDGFRLDSSCLTIKRICTTLAENCVIFFQSPKTTGSVENARYILKMCQQFKLMRKQEKHQTV